MQGQEPNEKHFKNFQDVALELFNSNDRYKNIPKLSSKLNGLK